MSPEKETRAEGSKFNTKQKAMIAAIVVILLITVWQAVSLLGGNSAPSAPPPPPRVVQATPPSSTPNAGGPAAGGAPTASAPTPNNIPMPTPQVIQAQVPRDPEFLKQQQIEAQYIVALNQLQMLKIQREIAETNQAIATATLAKVTAEKNINDITKPPPPAAPPPGAYATKLVTPVAAGSQVVGENIPPPPIETKEISYVVISVAMQSERWSAVLGFQGKLYHVAIGDVLPMDGSEVISISREGVVLKKGDTTRKISIISSI